MRTAVVTAVALVLLCLLSAVGGFAHVDFEGDGGGCGTFIERPDSTPDDDPSWDPAGKYHRYGTEPGEFTIGTYFPTFNRIFDLYLTDDVASRWDSTDVAYFINRVIDEDSTNTDDIFPREMPYFTDADEDERYGYVEYHTVNDDSVYTKFVIKLYSDHDFTDGACSTYGNYWRECSKYSMAYRPTNGEFPYRAWTVLLLASDYTKDCGPLTAITVENVASRGFAHEFQHVCFGLNPLNRFYDSVNESLAKLAEYMTGGDQDKTCDISYDTSVLRGERCEPYRKYMAELVWMAYLYDAYQGSPGDPTDDLVYQWIREPDEDVPAKTELTMRSLGNLLSESQFSYLGGATGAERLKNLFQNYSVAKFADAPSFGEGLYGYETFNPLPDLGLMLDNCSFHAPGSCPQRPIDCASLPKSGCQNHSACWNVKILPPNYILDDDVENTIASVNGIYEDADESRDSVEVATYGTDYMVFKADSYYATGDHEFHFAMDGRRTNLPSNHELRASVIAYSVADDTLQLHPEHIVFVAPLTISPGSNEASCVVTDFGRSIKAVVICVGLVETVPQYGGNSFGYYVYDYEYGVYTPDDISSVEWNGDVFMTGDYTIPDSKTLVVSPGVNVRVWTDDLADTGYQHDAIELNVDGEIEAVGTSTKPITFAAWDMSGDSENDDDWTGFFITDNAPATGVFEHVIIKNATKAIQARAAFTIKNSVIEDCKYIGVTIAGDSANADSVYARHLTIRRIGGTGAIGVNALGKKAAICMDSCLVDDCRVGIETYTCQRASIMSSDRR